MITVSKTASLNKNNSESLSFGIFTDAHYASGRIYLNRYCGDSLQKLKDCVQVFNEKELSFVVNLGDIVDKAENRELQLMHLEEMKEVLAGLDTSIYHVLGNHDVEMLAKQEFLHALGLNRKQWYYSFDAAGYHFAVLDGNYRKDGIEYDQGNFDWTDTFIHKEQCEWLKNDLKRAGKNKTIVFIHQNIDHRLSNGTIDPHIVANAGEIRNILEEAGNVIAVIQGHYHDGYYQKINGIHYYTLGAMVVGEGLDHNAYATVTLHSNGKLIIENVRKELSINETF